MFVINATCNGCRLEAVNFGALNVVFNTWVFLGFFTYEIWAEFKKSCGNTEGNPCMRCTSFKCVKYSGFQYLEVES